MIEDLGNRCYLRRSGLTDTPRSEPLANVDSLINGLASDKSTNKTTGKGITSSVGVDNLRSSQDADWVSLDGWFARGSGNDNGWLSSLSNDDDTLALVVDLWKLSNRLGDLSNVLGSEIVGLSVGKSFRLVANEEISIWEDRSQLLLEELWD